MVNILSKEKISAILKILVLFLFSLAFLSFLNKSFASFVSEADIKLESQTAIYLFKDDYQNFNLNLEGLIPRDSKYIYKFTVANYDEEKRSDVNIEYKLKILTTTNLPLSFKVYKNELPTEEGATNIISEDEVLTDSGGAWYRRLTFNDSYNLYYNSNSKDTFYIEVDFPKHYASNISYQGLIDNIEILIDSKQIVS